MNDYIDCPECFGECQPAGIPKGGRVAWYCTSCDRLYPDGDYVTVEDRPLGMPR